jgi:hypothetical protein
MKALTTDRFKHAGLFRLVLLINDFDHLAFLCACLQFVFECLFATGLYFFTAFHNRARKHFPAFSVAILFSVEDEFAVVCALPTTEPTPTATNANANANAILAAGSISLLSLIS